MRSDGNHDDASWTHIRYIRRRRRVEQFHSYVSSKAFGLTEPVSASLRLISVVTTPPLTVPIVCCWTIYIVYCYTDSLSPVVRVECSVVVELEITERVLEPLVSAGIVLVVLLGFFPSQDVRTRVQQRALGIGA